MVFSSISFIGIFLPLLLLAYALAGGNYRKYVLLAGSLIFYAVGEPYYIFLLITSLAVNHFLCGQMEKNKKVVLAIVLLWNFGLLFFFKYSDFFIENINLIAGKELIPALDLPLPLGISFYTFQIVSYQADVYRGVQKRNPDFFEFSLYVCMFPQLVAGPIVQYHEIEPYIKKPAFHMRNVENGLKVFTLGLGFKVLLANQIGTLFQTVQGIGAKNLNMPAAWLGAFAYTFQIYFDFWGYSLMAAGLGQMFGYRIPANFNHPYLSASVTEFWRRWHITLSRWFRDYVYIPLGGSRKGRGRTFFNLFVVWGLTGLWHGASWNFILWGLFFFLLLVIEKSGLSSFLARHRGIGHLYVAVLIPVSWMIFAQTDLGTLAAYLKAMAGANFGHGMVGSLQLLRYVREYAPLLVACLLCCTSAPVKLFQKYKNSIIMVLLLFGVFWFSVYQIYAGKDNPFLYFRF